MPDEPSGAIAVLTAIVVSVGIVIGAAWGLSALAIQLLT